MRKNKKVNTNTTAKTATTETTVKKERFKRTKGLINKVKSVLKIAGQHTPEEVKKELMTTSLILTKMLKWVIIILMSLISLCILLIAFRTTFELILQILGGK